MNPHDVLAELAYFSGLPDDEIDTLCAASEVILVKSGDVVIEDGALPQGLLVVAEGNFEAYRRTADEDLVLGIVGPGGVLGEMSVLEDRPTSAAVRALEDGSLVRVPVEHFRRVLADPVLHTAMFQTVIGRLREREEALVHGEKLASLGVLAAGLLHEVNNPAAAMARAAHHLGQLIGDLLPPRQGEAPTGLERARQIDRISDLVDPSGVERELAASLVDQGWRGEDLVAIDPAQRLSTARLVHARQLAGEIGMAAARLTELVQAVKRWTFSGQGPLQPVDFNQVVNDSLVLLRHKTAGKRIDLDLGEVAPVEGRGVELSQVVTNLVDNALDAADHLVLVTTMSGDGEVILEVADDGAGIPPDLVARIWEPFFTTKEPGQGSGLGLGISRRIAISHGGRLDVESEPGKTVFRLVLPRPN
ncbi:MAG: sensor histidine kinase [Actinomycetota bacterium]